MKPHRDAIELAARLGAAANTPMPLPTPPELAVVPAPAPQARARANPSRTKRNEATTDTVPITLRPPHDLLDRYVLAAAERTLETRRVTSAQEIMIAVLERGP